MNPTERKERLRQLAALYLKLGFLGFGGPAATISYMEEEVVGKRRWLTRDYFMDLVGATNLIPGPNSTEMAIHVGYIRAGLPGLAVAGASFILPAALITFAFAWAYVRYGSLPAVAPFLFGIKPAVIAVIAGAIVRLGKVAVKEWRLAAIGVGVTAAALLGASEILALLAGGVLGMLWLRLSERRDAAGGGGGALAVALLGWQGLRVALRAGAAGVVGATAAQTVGLWQLGLFFLKIGSILYGSGYVLVAFLQGGLVQGYGWLTEQQLLDAIAVGQFTPGPVLSTSTFIGYLLSGVPGAVVATVAIFFPSFVFVLLLNRAIPRLRGSPWTSAFLDAVNVAALGLMGAVVVQLGATTLTSWPAWLIAAAAAALALVWRVNATWLIVGGALVGALLSRWA